MPNTKQPEQNKEWRERFDKIYNDWLSTTTLLPVLKKDLKNLITNLLKEQLEKVNKEVIGNREEFINDDSTESAYHQSQRDNGFKKIRNEFRLEQRQKLDEIKEML